jgi:hypothetical protein
MAAPSVSVEPPMPSGQLGATNTVCPIRVTEHLLSFMARGRPVRSELVNDIDGALHIRWISKVPGEKRIEVWHGRLVVMQSYLGHRIVRAHIEVSE